MSATYDGRLRRRNGITLLEVVVAMAIMSTVAVSALAAVAEAMRSTERWQVREFEINRAAEVLLLTSLLPRNRLDLLLGDRMSGTWVVNVQRPRPTLYRIAVRDSAPGTTELLVTVVFRANPER
jgi:prepilin-type N-terminal cleavage/methylation domain-containing protein